MTGRNCGASLARPRLASSGARLYVRRFVRFLLGQGAIAELPRNHLDSFPFDTQHAVKTYPTQQVRDLLASLRDKLRLYALLGLNCGFYACDIGQLLQSELRDNRIVRRRSKTKMKQGTPTVDHPLWPETLALIERFRSGHPQYVFVSERGTPLWRTWTEGGKLREANLIAVHWGKQTMPQAALRHVSANLLRQNKEYALHADLFLGHAPKSMCEKHYYGFGQAHFDKAVVWLRSQFFPLDTLPSVS